MIRQFKLTKGGWRPTFFVGRFLWLTNLLHINFEMLWMSFEPCLGIVSIRSQGRTS